MRILSLVVLTSFLLASCGFKHPVQTAMRAKPTATPSEFYGQARPASFSPSSSSPFPGQQKAESGDSTFPETKSEKTHVAVIGVLAGLLVVAGTVVPIVLTR